MKFFEKTFLINKYLLKSLVPLKLFKYAEKKEYNAFNSQKFSKMTSKKRIFIDQPSLENHSTKSKSTGTLL